MPRIYVDNKLPTDRHYADQSGSCTVSGRHHSEDRCAEKAGILRPGVPVVYLDGDADASAVICRKASELGCDTDTGVEKGLYFPWISEEIH